MDSSTAPKPKRKIGERHKQAVLLFLAFVVAYAQRVNVSVGIVAMTDATINPKFPTLNYTTQDKGRISAMFFYGYLVSGVPAGILVDRYSPVKLLAIIGGIFCGVATLAIPLAAVYINIYAVYVLRIAQGLGQGFFFPGVNAALSKWIIPQERGQFSWIWTGTNLGTILMMVVGGVLSDGPTGWPSIFYGSGAVSILWGVLILVFGADSPAVVRSISDEERNYIESNLLHSTSNEKLKIPWCALATSVPFLALAFTHMCEAWGYFTLLTLIPTYIHGVYGFNASSNGFLSALPYVGFMFGGLVISLISGSLSTRFSKNFVRKFFNSVGYFGCALALGLLSLIRTNASGAIALLTAATTLNSGIFSGYQINHLDLAPNFAGMLMGFTNGGSNVASIIAPQFATHVVADESNNSQWQIVFLVSAGVFTLGNVVFLVFGSTDLQPWNAPNGSQTDSKMDEKVYTIDIKRDERGVNA